MNGCKHPQLSGQIQDQLVVTISIFSNPICPCTAAYWCIISAHSSCRYQHTSESFIWHFIHSKHYLVSLSPKAQEQPQVKEGENLLN